MRISVVISIILCAPAFTLGLPHGRKREIILHELHDSGEHYAPFHARANEEWGTFHGPKIRHPLPGEPKLFKGEFPPAIRTMPGTHMRYRVDSRLGKITHYNTHIHNVHTNTRDPKDWGRGARYRDNDHQGGSAHNGIIGPKYYPTGGGIAHPATGAQIPPPLRMKDDIHVGQKERTHKANLWKHKEAPF